MKTRMCGLGALALFSISSLYAEETLSDQLKKQAEISAKKFSDEIKMDIQKGIESVKESNVTDTAKQVGDKAPNFTLKNHKGEEVELTKELAKGPVVLTWYRGGWCPYCNITMAAYQSVLAEIKAEGANLIALTPELPDKSLTTIEKNKLDFHVLTDLNLGVGKEYGILFKLTPAVRDRYKSFFDLNKFNGADASDDTLPLAATYIIDQQGIIRWAFLDADYKKRAEPSEMIDALKRLAK